MYYSEAISFPPLFTLLVFVLYAIIALAPAYGVFRQKDYVTALICVVCGLFSVFVLPYLAAVVIALKKLPRDQEPVIDSKIRTALFGGTLLLFMIVPFISFYGISISGFTFFFKLSMMSRSVTDVVLFIAALVIGIILSLILRGKNALAGNAVMVLISSEIFTYLMINLIAYGLESFGSYVVFFMLAVMICVNAYCWHVAFTSGSMAEAKVNAQETAAAMGRMMKQGAEKLQMAASKAAQGAFQLKDSFEKNQQAGRDYRQEQNQPQSNPAENADFRNPNPQSVVRPLRLVCRSGEYAGAELELTPGMKISLGTDPTKCNLVFNSLEISRLHCVIFCSENPGMVVVQDLSSNGTMCTANGSTFRLPRQQAWECPLPCRISFGKYPEVFEITVR